jgi:hypothetical protein
LGVIKLGVELQQEAGTTGFQFKPVHLAGAQKENGMFLYRVVYKINLMAAIPVFNGQYEKEVVPVQIMYQLASAQNILDPTDFEPFRGWQFRLRGTDLPDWNFFHFDFICLPKIMTGAYFTVMVRRCTVWAAK